MEWSDTNEPNERIRYHHVLAETPAGEMSIEWKGWKLYDAYVVYLEGEYLSAETTLEGAKVAARLHLLAHAQRLSRTALAIVEYIGVEPDESLSQH